MSEKRNDLMQNTEPLLYQATYLLNPVPASRPRVTRWGVYYGKKYTQFKKDMQQLVTCSDTPLNGSLRASVTFLVQIPKSRKKECLQGKFCNNNSDIDNYLKALFDSMNKIIFEDDKQIVEVHAKKVWSDNGKIEVSLYDVH